MRKYAFLLKALYLQQVNIPKCNIKSTKVYMHFYFVLIEQLRTHTALTLHFYCKEVSMFSRRFRSDLHITIWQENTHNSCLCAFISIIINYYVFSVLTSFCLNYGIAVRWHCALLWHKTSRNHPSVCRLFLWLPLILYFWLSLQTAESVWVKYDFPKHKSTFRAMVSIFFLLPIHWKSLYIWQIIKTSC